MKLLRGIKRAIRTRQVDLSEPVVKRAPAQYPRRARLTDDSTPSRPGEARSSTNETSVASIMESLSW